MTATVRTPEYWREHYQIDQMPIGGTVAVSSGELVRVRRSEYCLHHAETKNRARWGTAKEIAEDVAHLEAFGVLPAPNGKPW